MIGIIGAMDVEVTEIKKLMTDIKQVTIHGIDFTTGRLSNHEVVLVLSDIAKVNAAIRTTLLLTKFDIEGVINIGTAGGLMTNQKVLDVVVSTKVAHHDWDIYADNWPKGFNQTKTCYTADPHYVAIMQSIIEENNDKVWVGPIASGDMFVSKDFQVEKIKKEFPEALCAEMEAAAVAQTCRLFECPFVVIRSLSDVTLSPNNEMDFDTYVAKASERSAIWCQKFVEKI